MDDICRLCCSTSFVNNNIFDEENALYLKMSLYLPIKVFKNDHLPQKVCDKCSCKVNDFYQFCNETIEVQNRLRAVLLSSGIITEDTVDLTLVKENLHSPVPPANIAGCDQSTQTENESEPVETETNETDTNRIPIEIKLEPSTVKTEEENPDFESFEDSYMNFDSSEDESLINLKKRKRRTRKMNMEVTNGSVNESKKTRKKKQTKDWETLIKALPETTFSVVKTNSKLETVKEEDSGDQDGNLDHVEVKKKIKHEPNEADIYHCCICFTQCYSRAEMLHHYKQHASEADSSSGAPAAPPPPDQHPLRCTRCQKVLERSAWAEHWARHWERDRRPYRCALCEKTFRDHHQILKHGMTHKLGEEGPEEQPANKRFICDLCPEGFVYMRYLLSHRTRAHPEAATRALTLRCAQCGRQFAHLNSLRRHLRAHSGERNHLCNVCGKALSSREHLKFHIRIHTGYKPNVCKTCGKGFVKKCNLTLHERVHSGEKPHVCPHCGKAFSQRSTLVIHERYHSGARPYVCALCNRGFVAKGLLSMHLKTTCI